MTRTIANHLGIAISTLMTWGLLSSPAAAQDGDVEAGLKATCLAGESAACDALTNLWWACTLGDSTSCISLADEGAGAADACWILGMDWACASDEGSGQNDGWLLNACADGEDFVCDLLTVVWWACRFGNTDSCSILANEGIDQQAACYALEIEFACLPPPGGDADPDPDQGGFIMGDCLGGNNGACDLLSGFWWACASGDSDACWVIELEGVEDDDACLILGIDIAC